MDFKHILSQMTNLQEEAKSNVTTHVGTYGKSYDVDDDDGDEKKADAPKRGRGRPRKGADATGHVPNHKVSKDAPAWLTGGKFKAPKVKPAQVKKHSLKDWFEHMNAKMLAEAEQLDELSPDTLNSYSRKAKGEAQWAHGVSLHGSYDGKTPKSPEMKKYADHAKKRVAGANLAAKKGATDKGSEAYDWARKGGYGDASNPAIAENKFKDAIARHKAKKLGEDSQELTTVPAEPGAMDIKNKDGKVVATAKNPAAAEMIKKGEISLAKDDDADLNEAKKAKAKVSNRNEKTVSADIQEADQPACGNDKGAGLGKGRSQKTLEAKDKKLAFGGKQATPFGKKDDKKKDVKKDDKKKKVTESAEHRKQAAHHAGKGAALSKQLYSCPFDDPEEVHMYLEGYKEGLDELYAQMPDVEVDFSTDSSMEADPFGDGAMDTDMSGFDDDLGGDDLGFSEPDRTPIGGMQGGMPSAMGGIQRHGEFDEMAFESLTKQLDELLNEGMTVSISKGQQGAPDSVSVNASDEDSDKLLALVKQAGLGIFADDAESSGYGAPMQDQPVADPEADTDNSMPVVGGHDSMLDLIKKVTDQEGGAEGIVGMDVQHPDSEDSDVEETEFMDQSEEVAEQTPNDDGRLQGFGPDAEIEVDEAHNDTAFGADAEMRAGVEDDDQEERQPSAPSDREPNSKGQLDFTESEDDDSEFDVDDPKHPGFGEREAEKAERRRDAKRDEDAEEEMNEGLANGAENTFEAELEYLTKLISGGANKEKSTGQSTVPVVASQDSRLGNPMSESSDLLKDWKKLSGLAL